MSNATDIEERIRQGFAELQETLRAGLVPQRRPDEFKAATWETIAATYRASPERLGRLVHAANYLHPDAPADQRPAVQQEAAE